MTIYFFIANSPSVQKAQNIQQLESIYIILRTATFYSRILLQEIRQGEI